MSDFNPVTLYFILSESLGVWLWLLVALALVLLAGIVFGFRRLRSARRPAKRSLMMALAVGLVAAAAFTFLVPVWSLSGPGAMTTGLDHAVALLFALVPAAMIASAVFFMAAMRCARMARRIPTSA